MSDRKGEREWRFYPDDMISFAQKVLLYTDGLEKDGFISRGLAYDATLRNLELIGEAATRVPNEIRVDNPDVPWRLIIATRNRLIHAYLGIDDDTIWSIVQDDVPVLLSALEKIREQHNNNTEQNQ